MKSKRFEYRYSVVQTKYLHDGLNSIGLLDSDILALMNDMNDLIEKAADHLNESDNGSVLHKKLLEITSKKERES